MAEWCMAHPYLTFFLIAGLIQAIAYIFGPKGDSDDEV